jgi:hypothetical protein
MAISVRPLIFSVAFFALGCGSSGNAAKIDNVQVDPVDSGLVVHYRTKTSIRDCEAHQVEMPYVWDQVVKPRLKDPAVKNVFLSPEEPSGRSVGMTFTQNTSGQWSTRAPCSITIPAVR